MFFALLFTLAQKLDTGGVHQLVQACWAACVRHLNIELTLTPAQGAVVGYGPVQTGQSQQ